MVVAQASKIRVYMHRMHANMKVSNDCSNRCVGPLLLAPEKDKDEFLKRISSTPRDRKISPTGSDIKLFDVPLHA